MFKQVLFLLRARCTLVYTVGEHGTAFFYAVCELPEHIARLMWGEYMLYGFSIVLLIGVIFVAVDKLLNYLGW
jgi:hypothetical protein